MNKKAIRCLRKIRGTVSVGRVEVFYCASVKSNKEAEQSGESGLCVDTPRAAALNSDIGDGKNDSVHRRQPACAIAGPRNLLLVGRLTESFVMS